MLFTIVILAIAAIFHVTLGLITLLNNRKSIINRIFSLFIFCGVLWVFVNILINISTSSGTALFWSKIALAPAIGIVYFFLIFTKIFPLHTEISKQTLLWYSIIPISLISLSFTSLNVKSIGPHGSNLVIGPIYKLSLAYIISYCLIGAYYLTKSYKKANSIQKLQLQYLIAGIIFSFIPAIILNGLLPFFNIYQYASIGPAVVVIFAFFASIAIIRHRLFDIRLVVARSIAYTLLLITLASVYGIGTFAASSYLFKQSVVSSGQQIFNIVLALILAFTFQPLKRFFEKITDSIFYRNKYDSQTVINEISRILASELILDRILKDTLAKICKDMRVQNGQYYIYDSNKIFKIEHHGPSLNKIITPHELLELKHHMLIADEMEESSIKRMLTEHNIRVSVMLRTKDQFVGYLLLGDKLSGDIYSTQDIALLETLSSELAVGIVNSKAYEKIARFNITLQEKVNEATGNLRIANENLKALDKTKDEFISLASHQLRTPLTTIKGYLSMIQEGDAGKITTQQKEFINYAYLGAERMVRLIADLLNVSRLSSGRFYIENKPLDMAAMIKEEIGQLAQQAEGKNIKLIYQPPEKSLSPILLDDDKIRQVIMNFIDNAVFYTREGSVTVKLAQVNDSIRFTVTDTGIGVPEADKKKLFTKFYRASNAQVLRPDGTGLGIYLAKKVIEEEGGKMIFDSIEGKGSTFGFEIPIDLKDREQVNQTAPTVTAENKTKEIIKV